METENHAFSSRQIMLCATVGLDYALQHLNVDVSTIRHKFIDKFLHHYQLFQAVENEYKSESRRGRGFYFVKRTSKRYGFLYYVRYTDKGKTIPSMWNTHTNILSEAEEFALRNRRRIIDGYRSRQEEKKNNTALFKIFETYYEKDSEYLLLDEKRNNPLGDKRRRSCLNHVNNVFLPFLVKNNIRFIKDIKPHLFTNYQNEQLKKGNKPQTVNDNISGLKRIFNHLVSTGKIDVNPFSSVESLTVLSKDKKTRGCHDLSKPNGVFNAEWEDGYSELLMLLIYTTDMRNIELERIKMADIERIEDCRFIRIEQSKSENGIRLVPLHEFVYERMAKYAREKGLKEDDCLILEKPGKRLHSDVYKRANIELGRRLGVSEEELTKENLTFYSGRHFWKTLMNSEGLGDDIEEVFMGHKVSSDVAKLYNHKDKRGKERMLESARNVYKILDENLFGKKPDGEE